MSASKTSSGGGIDLQTLVITAVASAAAAYACSKLWAPGTLGAAATMPVLVALLKEALAKPATVVTRAVPVRGVVRSADRVDEPYDPVQPFEPEDERVAQHGEIAGSSHVTPQRAWKAAVVTGLLGFLVAAVIITVPEFVAGSSAGGGDRQTTFFGGKQKSSEPSTTTTTPGETETAPAEPTVSVPPVETTTVPPAETTTLPEPEPEPEPAPEPPPPPEEESANP